MTLIAHVKYDLRVYEEKWLIYEGKIPDLLKQSISDLIVPHTDVDARCQGS